MYHRYLLFNSLIFSLQLFSNLESALSRMSAIQWGYGVKPVCPLPKGAKKVIRQNTILDTVEPFFTF